MLTIFSKSTFLLLKQIPDNVSMKKVHVLNVIMSLDEPHVLNTTRTYGILEKQEP